MRSLAALSFVAGVAASPLVQRSSCWFGITASGGQSGSLGQLDDGQIRIGGGLAPSSFSITDGAITDEDGFGCILTDGVKQFQCDHGKPPVSGFSIGSNGTLSYSGDATFHACPASESEWNVYTTPVEGQKKCVEVSLTASGCGEYTPGHNVPASTITVHDCEATTVATYPVTTSVPLPTIETYPPTNKTYPPGIQTHPPNSIETYPPPVQTYPPQSIESHLPSTGIPPPPVETYPPQSIESHLPSTGTPPPPVQTYPPQSVESHLPSTGTPPPPVETYPPQSVESHLPSTGTPPPPVQTYPPHPPSNGTPPPPVETYPP
ncbi:hypothetical protein JHW43_009493, partial [Diplocarpon mali]